MSRLCLIVSSEEAEIEEKLVGHPCYMSGFLPYLDMMKEILEATKSAAR